MNKINEQLDLEVWNKILPHKLLLLLTLLGTSINKNKTNNNNITLEEYKGSDVLVVTTEKSPTKFIHYCEAQGKGRARGRLRKVTQRSFKDCRL